MTVIRRTLALAIALLLATPATAQVTTSPAGTGPYPAEVATDPALPLHTIFRPVGLPARAGKLPILVWGNGGCRDNGIAYRPYHLELASHGYLLIANGAPGTEPEIVAPLPGPASQLPKPERKPAPQSGKTTTDQMIQALDWAIAENSRQGSPYFGKLDATAIAAMGTSCGGLQALWVSAHDKRIKTSVIGNSGIYEDEPSTTGLPLKKATLQNLHAPLIYLNGGPTDMAYANGHDDFDRINHVPVVFANIDVGHSGAYRNPNGGKVAPVAIAWLDWQLKGDRQAGRMFTGAKCGLCTNPEWRIERKGIR